MLWKILIVVAVIVIGLAVVVALQPASFRVTRTATISASPAAVFAQVNDFHNWVAWSPWEKLDPGMKRSYEGAPSGAGAMYAWSGNSQVGEGRMTVTESRPSDLIRIKLDFEKPFRASNIAEFTFEPRGEQTAVTWTMTGRKNFVAKAIHLVMSMDRMIGGAVEQGLSQMKAVVGGSRRCRARRGARPGDAGEPAGRSARRCNRQEGARRRADAARHDLPHRFDDQADRGRGGHDPGRGMQAASG